MRNPWLETIQSYEMSSEGFWLVKGFTEERQRAASELAGYTWRAQIGSALLGEELFDGIDRRLALDGGN
jgi:hypothetical protein